MEVERWEDLEQSVFRGTCLSLNRYCVKDEDNFRACCGKPVPASGMPSSVYTPYCLAKHFKIARGYPRHGEIMGIRVMVHAAVPTNNPFCGVIGGQDSEATLPPSTDISPTEVTEGAEVKATTTVTPMRRRRSVEESKHAISQDLLKYLLDQNATQKSIKDGVVEAGHSDLVLKLNYSTSLVFNEDAAPITTAAPPVLVQEESRVHIIVLAVLFAVAGCVAMFFVLWFVITNPDSCTRRTKKSPST